ncbi:MAG: hypothetical protein Q9187_008203, partial [Circinaria calcarea]
MARKPRAIPVHDKDEDVRLQKGEADLPEPPQTPTMSPNRGSWLRLTPEIHSQRLSEKSRKGKEEDRFQKELNEALDYHQARIATMDIDPDAFELLVERNKSIRKTLDERQKQSEEDEQRRYEGIFNRRVKHAALTSDEQTYLEAVRTDYKQEAEEHKLRRVSGVSTLGQDPDEETVKKRRSMQQAVISRYRTEKARETEIERDTICEGPMTGLKEKSQKAKVDQVTGDEEDNTASVKGAYFVSTTTKHPAELSLSKEPLQGLPHRFYFEEAKTADRGNKYHVPQIQRDGVPTRSSSLPLQPSSLQQQSLIPQTMVPSRATSAQADSTTKEGTTTQKNINEGTTTKANINEGTTTKTNINEGTTTKTQGVVHPEPEKKRKTMRQMRKDFKAGLPNPFASHRAEQAQKRAALTGTTNIPNKVAPVEQPNRTTPKSPDSQQQVMKVSYNRNAKLLDDCFRTGDNPTARHWPNGVQKDAKLTAAFFKGVVRSTEMYLGYMKSMNAAEVKKRLLADVEVKSCDAFAKYILTSDPKEKAFYQSETERCMLATENFSELNDIEVKELLLQGLREKLTEAEDFADEVEHKNAEEIKAAVDSLTADGRVPFFAEVRFGMNQRLAAPKASTSLNAGNIKLDRKEKESVLEKRLAKKELGETEENPRMDLEFVSRAHFNLAKKIIRETHGDVAHNDAALIQKYKDQAASDRYPWEWDEE